MESPPNTYLQLSAAPPCITFRRSLGRVAGAFYKLSRTFHFSTHWVVVVVMLVLVVVMVVVLVMGWRWGGGVGDAGGGASGGFGDGAGSSSCSSNF
jgi:hypothetical protein